MCDEVKQETLWIKYFASFWYIITFWGPYIYMYECDASLGSVLFEFENYWIQSSILTKWLIWWMTYGVCLNTWHTNKVIFIFSCSFEIVGLCLAEDLKWLTYSETF
jgi:hypothetical protein